MAANLPSYKTPFYFFYSSTPNLNLPRFPFFRNPNLIAPFSLKLALSSSNTRSRHGYFSLCYNNKSTSDMETALLHEEIERTPFDINRAVVLAGFAFEAYTTPTENIGKSEVDAAGCQTVILSESFLREIYDGQLFVKLKNGYEFPAMDPWVTSLLHGTSDPYVVLQLDSQIVKSNESLSSVRTKEPTWNEELTLYIKNPPTNDLQVAAWDANLVTPHKRMGNSSVNLESICDGNSHEVLVELEGMGGGGKVQLEEEKNWRIPFLPEFLRNNGFESTLRKVVGSEPIQARQFVEYAFGQLKSINDAYIQRDGSSDDDKYAGEDSRISSNLNTQSDIVQTYQGPEDSLKYESNQKDEMNVDTIVTQMDVSSQSDKDFWKTFADTVNQNVVKQLGLPAPEKIKWEGFDLLSRVGLLSQSIAEAGYIEAGLATPSGQDALNDDETTDTSTNSTVQSSFPDIKKVTQDLLRQTDSLLGTLMVLNATVSELTKDGGLLAKSDTKEDVTKEEKHAPECLKSEKSESSYGEPVLDERKAEEMRALFSTAESAMEAWAMLATSLGHPSFIKSEFEKICFLDNSITDTQVAIWRDSARKRLVVAFRGTEQVRWKDLRTDLMLAPAGLNPERIGGDFKEEVQVHSGFLSAYDSVRTRIISLIKAATGYQDDGADQASKWHVYVTGHSLGGALATLLALELSSSQLAKSGAISVTMYNFGSPRVGNKNFAEVYNEKVKDSWRVVNHRDIIPSIPRLMGYCHVAHPIYLAAGDAENTLENIELLGDGYEGDVIGESTPDALVNEFMKGEKELIEKILNTEINIFRSIRDGTALMQHMEDFYYVSLLENVRSNYQTVVKTKSGDGSSSSVREV
ncbi:C2 calcium-dependent membrane targeting [Cynara cardunculus var. scolymus]|uniref:C2 calcium-dependent membrane targeting n=1 Tax=Cynara cardunculus var. scolymus TaxID=59895 RepID=A0A118JU66_CYNCS|nr:C2 calcium-dependent membrane targeting [Cynara cardunculus var. scolymus]